VRFCGVGCAASYRGSVSKKLQDKNCKECDNNFSPARSSAVFCTQSCRAIWTNKNRVKPNKKKTYLSKTESGGLPYQNFRLFRMLGDGWHPEYWVSPFGELGEEYVFFKLDIVNLEYKINIEVDGKSHLYNMERDEVRDKWLRSKGWTVLRFTNEEVKNSIDEVVVKILSVFTT
jgi:hypothetical protein